MAELIILADGGGGIGFGHLMRCLAIKNAWRSGDAQLLVQMEGADIAPDGAESFDWLKKVEGLKQYVSKNTFVLVDSYRPDIDYFRRLKAIFPFIAVLDDYNRVSYPVDLVICPGVHGGEIDYSNQLAKTVGGADYVIIRQEILAARKIEVRENLEIILVTLGGSQKNEILFQRINDLLESNGYQVIIVTGNDQVAKQLYKKKSQIYGKLDQIKMAEIMASVDVAISAAGQTLNELAWLGMPTLSIKTGEDQHGNWDYYSKHNLSLGAVVFNAHNLESALIKTLKNATAERRLDRSLKLRDLLTATGAEKICSIIESIEAQG